MSVPSLDAFQAIADPSRRYMLRMLTDDSMTISAIAQHFDMSRPAVSKHLKILELAGFITVQDIGRERYCMLQQDGFDELQEWIGFFDKFWLSKLKKLQRILDEKKDDHARGV
ncbi:metalloregulator ArsR/SmtB family transcription factor [Chitinophaga sedimenti]|uniref:ArsR/SmtB family transcription factor n=1 Tax=Chitinophaga sedimenti TaxID=2033606 RepID=UPI00200337C2|nr:metalloregulator ArsR/SmtB family transcription factor [Chitinophaga sedimenti]MCK7556276.1 metalloregulator ArsR/SmtB family transcription factor [Chitinophaga sedimenti]